MNKTVYIGFKTGEVSLLNKYKEIYNTKTKIPAVLANNKKNNSLIFIADRKLFEYKKSIKKLNSSISYCKQLKYINNDTFFF